TRCSCRTPAVRSTALPRPSISWSREALADEALREQLLRVRQPLSVPRPLPLLRSDHPGQAGQWPARPAADGPHGRVVRGGGCGRAATAVKALRLHLPGRLAAARSTQYEVPLEFRAVLRNRAACLRRPRQPWDRGIWVAAGRDSPALACRLAICAACRGRASICACCTCNTPA